MAYDEDLADRVRDSLGGRDGLTERRMFGGVGFMIGGNMAVGVINEDLIVRLDEADAESALTEPHVRAFDYTGRPMRGWVYVGAELTGSSPELLEWVEAGAAHAASLPAK